MSKEKENNPFTRENKIEPVVCTFYGVMIPEEKPKKIDKYSLELKTTILDDGVVEQEQLGIGGNITRWIIDTRDQAIREALIKLGWTPPSESKE